MYNISGSILGITTNVIDILWINEFYLTTLDEAKRI